MKYCTELVQSGFTHENRKMLKSLSFVIVLYLIGFVLALVQQGFD